MFRNLHSRRMAVPLIVAILAMAVLFTLAIMATSLPVLVQQTGLSPTVAKEALYVLRADWPVIEIASATHAILEEIA
jgi:hypothetical protein